MLRLNAVASKPPAYPFIHLHFKEQEDKTSRGASFLAFPEPPCLQNFLQHQQAYTRHRRNLPASNTLKRRLRFGEAVSRQTHIYPQEEKTPSVAFSSQIPIFLQNLRVGGIFTKWSGVLTQHYFAGLKRNSKESYSSPPIQNEAGGARSEKGAQNPRIGQNFGSIDLAHHHKVHSRQNRRRIGQLMQAVPALGTQESDRGVVRRDSQGHQQD
jgi:hypothetical protein